MSTIPRTDPSTAGGPGTAFANGGAAADDARWTVHRAPLPSGLEHPDAWALLGAVEVGRVVDTVVYGHDDLAQTAAETLAFLRNEAYATRMLLVATPATDTPVTGTPAAGPPGTGTPAADTHPDTRTVLGSATISMPTRGNTHAAELLIRVHPEARGRGAGTALLEAAERITAEHGRTSLISFTDHLGEPSPDDPHLSPPTGSGRIASGDPGPRFALRRGYRLEQAERYSALDLPVDPALVARLHAEAARHAGADYRLVSWTDRTPDRWADDLARLRTRMTTDVPSADLDLEEDPWDADRVRTADASVAASGHGYLLVAAEHVPTGTLAAYTMLEYPLDKPAVVFQEDTLVLSEHRGRHLGMLVKTAALELLTALRPHARRVHTWNAEENAYMLAINVALGFRPLGVSGMWQKRTT
jgi:GNAT superfamily N-acetyltransferase